MSLDLETKFKSFTVEDVREIQRARLSGKKQDFVFFFDSPSDPTTWEFMVENTKSGQRLNTLLNEDENGESKRGFLRGKCTVEGKGESAVLVLNIPKRNRPTDINLIENKTSSSGSHFLLDKSRKALIAAIR